MYFFQYFQDLKRNTKTKFANIKTAHKGTDGGPASRQTLSSLEERVLRLAGDAALVGDEAIIEPSAVFNNDLEKIDEVNKITLYLSCI